MKSEPDEFSIDDLKKARRHHWDGVRNYEARNMMRDKMKVGDMVIFYHSSAQEVGPAGVARVASRPYPDHTQFDPHSPYYDAKATPEASRWWMIDVAFVERFAHVLSRSTLKECPPLQHMMLWKRARLSITPLSKNEFDVIRRLGGAK